MENFDLKIAKTPQNPLEYGIKMKLQIYLMKKMIGESATSEEILGWIDKFAKEISQIVDNENNKDIRELAKNGNFEEASELIFRKIEQSDLKKAA